MIAEIWIERVLLHHRVCSTSDCEICHALENLKEIAKAKGLTSSKLTNKVTTTDIFSDKREIGSCETCGKIFHRTEINRSCEICEKNGLPSKIISELVIVL